MKINSKAPFKVLANSPAPLTVRVRRRVHFGECDPLGVLWHGHYAGYFSEVREALARLCGLTYEHFLQAGTSVPVKTMFVDYFIPLFFDRVYTVETSMHWSDAARINLTYQILDQDERVTTTGFTVQLMTDAAGILLLDSPRFYRQFLEDWAAGRMHGRLETAKETLI